MKKTLTRMMSLILVLVMMLGIVPMASASGTADLTIETNSDPVSFTVAAAASDAPAHNYIWETTGGTLGITTTTDVPDNTFTASDPGTYTITCTLQVWENGSITSSTPYTYTIKVENPKVLVGSVNIISGTYALNMTTKTSENLTPTVEGVGGGTPANGKLVWTVSPSGYVSLTPAANGKDCVVTALKPTGDTEVVVTATANDGSGKKDTCIVTVAAPTQTGIKITAAGGATKVGVEQDLVLTAEALPQYANFSGALTWTVEAGTGTAVVKSSSGNSCTVTGKSAGAITVKVTDGTHSASLPLTVENTSCTVTLAPATVALAKGETSAPLTVTVTDAAGKTITSGYTVDLVPTDDTKVSANDSAKTLTGLAKGSTTVKAVVTYGGKTFESNTINVSVAEASITLAPAKLTLGVGEVSDALTITVKDETGTAITDTAVLNTITLVSDATAKATVDNTTKKVTGVASGTANITAKFTYEGTEYTSNACAVTVGKGTLSYNNYSASATASNSHTIDKSKITWEGKPSGYVLGTHYTLKFSRSGSAVGTISVTEGGYVSGSGVSAIRVKMEAWSTDSTPVLLAEGSTSISFYQHNSVTVTMAKGLQTMSFGNANHVEGSSSLYSEMISGYESSPAFDADDKVSLGLLTSQEGSYQDASGLFNILDNGVVSGLDDLSFSVGTAGSANFDYTITDSYVPDAVVCMGQVTIIYDQSLLSIEYTTTTGKNVTFKEADFAEFWSETGKSTSLSYVMFGVTSKIPEIGELYSNTTASAVTTATEKYLYWTIPTTGYKDLGSATYAPHKTLTTTYDVVIPFVAYGSKYSTSNTTDCAAGQVIIHVNPKTNAITSRGVYFGTEYDTVNDLTYMDQMASTYYDKTGKILDHVILTLPAAEQATLYSKVPTSGQIAQSVKLSYNTRLYYKPATSAAVANALLKNVAIVPAAGYSGPVTIYFTGYSSGGNNEATCSITFDVKTKTASGVFSDVTAKNYSWASDSVDFLYYEGTAQGSNGKYNPAANITRRDFMLMLYRAFLAEDYGTYTVTTNFPDVVKGADAYSKEIYQAVGVAKYLGIAQGSNNKFNPTAYITRQEAMVLIYRTLETIGKDLRTDSGVRVSSMKDYTQISSWATTAISNLVKHGVIKGTNDYIKPAANITRAEMAAILHRVITY